MTTKKQLESCLKKKLPPKGSPELKGKGTYMKKRLVAIRECTEEKKQGGEPSSKSDKVNRYTFRYFVGDQAHEYRVLSKNEDDATEAFKMYVNSIVPGEEVDFWIHSVNDQPREKKVYEYVAGARIAIATKENIDKIKRIMSRIDPYTKIVSIVPEDGGRKYTITTQKKLQDEHDMNESLLKRMGEYYSFSFKSAEQKGAFEIPGDIERIINGSVESLDQKLSTKEGVDEFLALLKSIEKEGKFDRMDEATLEKYRDLMVSITNIYVGMRYQNAQILINDLEDVMMKKRNKASHKSYILRMNWNVPDDSRTLGEIVAPLSKKYEIDDQNVHYLTGYDSIQQYVRALLSELEDDKLVSMRRGEVDSWKKL